MRLLRTLQRRFFFSHSELDLVAEFIEAQKLLLVFDEITNQVRYDGNVRFITPQKLLSE